jgi:hypothetical protein
LFLKHTGYVQSDRRYSCQCTAALHLFACDSRVFIRFVTKVTSDPGRTAVALV